MKISGYILTILLAVLASSAFSQPPTLVVTEKTIQKNFHNQISLIGRTRGIIKSNIVAEISGRVKSIQTDEGTKVNKNQTLLTIDDQTISFLFQAKSAETVQAEVQAKLASERKERAVRLLKDNLISETGYDSSLALDAIQTAFYKKIQAEKSKLQIDLSNTKVKAPYAGYTGRRLVDVGAWVTPGMAVFEMVDISKIKIIVDLPEKYFGELQIGSPVIVKSSTVESTLNGVVVGISPSASVETHTYPVIIEVSNENEVLASGMLVQVTLSLDDEFTSIAVSKDAIVRKGNNTIVYTIKDGKASPIPVTIVSTDGVMLAVNSPMLSEGMVIFVNCGTN